MRNLRSEEEIVKSWGGDLSHPVVSVCCITYNQEPYIKDAIEGFLIQETNFPVEIIIHDDASTDATSKIIKAYAKAYPKLIKPLIRSENQYSQKGFSFIGDIFNKCNGKYIALCEGDDYWSDPKKLTTQVLFLENNPEYFLSIHNSKIVNVMDGSVRSFNEVKLPETLREHDVIMRRWFSPTASFVFRKFELDSEIGKGINGDMVILYSCALRGKVHYNKSVMSVYRLFSKGSLTNSSDRQELYKKKISFYKYCVKKSGFFLRLLLGFKILLTYFKMIVFLR